MHRAQIIQAESMPVGPACKLADGLGVGGPCVGVAVLGGEKLDKAARGTIASVGKEGRDSDAGQWMG